MNGPHIQFFGTLTRDPEQCFSQDEGIPYARLWVAVRTRYDDQQPPDTQDFEVYLWATTWTQRWPTAGKASRCTSLVGSPAGSTTGPTTPRASPTL